MPTSNLKSPLCRTCLVDISQDKVFNIFNTTGLSTKLMLCSGLAVETTDEYPENICEKCYKLILNFYEFQQMCCKSLLKFNEISKTKETLVDHGGNTNFQTTAKDNDSSAKDLNLGKHADKEFLERNERGRPPKKKLQVEKMERKTVIKTAKRSIIRNSTNEIKRTAEKEEFAGDEESENIPEIKNKEDQNEQVYITVEMEEIKLPKQCKKYKNEIIVQDHDYINRSLDIESSSSLVGDTFPQKQRHACDRCSKIFSSLHKLEAHIRKHDASSPYTCTSEGCERSFTDWHCYNKHRKEHKLKDEQSFKCDLENCERVYKNKSALNMHKRKFHNFGPELKTHMCEICGKVFKSSSVLNDHQYTHVDKTQLPYVCEEEGCCKRFSNKEKLKVHNMRHAGIKNFICPHCGMRKTTRNELKTHINYHTLERTWSCRFCPKVCNSAGNLKMHIKNIHERVKDFACRYCEQTFAKADTKKYHEMTHTGEKPHECKECGRRFLQPAALRTHRKIHLRQKTNLSDSRKRKMATATVDTTKERKVNTTTESIVAEILYDTSEYDEYLLLENGKESRM